MCDVRRDPYKSSLDMAYVSTITMRAKYKECKRRSASVHKIKLDIRSRVQCSRQKC